VVTVVLDAADVSASLTMTAIVSALESGLTAEAAERVMQPPRLNIMPAEGPFLRIGAAVIQDDLRPYIGFKAFHGVPGHGVRYLVCLYDGSSGELAAIMDAHDLTAWRTGAATGIAARHLAPRGAVDVAVIGSGLEAYTNLLGIAAVRQVRSVRVYSPRRERREAFRKRIDALGIASSGIDVAEDPRDCVDGASVVVVATFTGWNGETLAFHGEWMAPGMHVSTIGSTTPRLREVDPETFRRSDRLVVDSLSGVIAESGDVIAAMAAGTYPTNVIELKDLVANPSCGRQSPSEVTLYKSVGTAVQDVMAAAAVYEQARENGIGIDVGEIFQIRPF
jgi:alanine dehydrogenase